MLSNFIKIIFASIFILSCSQKQNKEETKKETYQIILDSNSESYSAKLIMKGIERELTFLSYKDDFPKHVYSEVRYSSDSSYNFRKNWHHSQKRLSDEIHYIKLLWESLKDKIKLDLKSGFISSEEQYEDIVQNQINLFQNSPHKLKYKYRGELYCGYDLNLYRAILLEGNIYQPFDSLLKTYGFTIIDYYPAEHNLFINKANLKKYNADTILIIPTYASFKIGSYF